MPQSRDSPVNCGTSGASLKAEKKRRGSKRKAEPWVKRDWRVGEKTKGRSCFSLLSYEKTNNGTKVSITKVDGRGADLVSQAEARARLRWKKERHSEAVSEGKQAMLFENICKMKEKWLPRLLGGKKAYRETKMRGIKRSKYKIARR